MPASSAIEVFNDIILFYDKFYVFMFLYIQDCTKVEFVDYTLYKHVGGWLLIFHPPCLSCGGGVWRRGLAGYMISVHETYTYRYF